MTATVRAWARGFAPVLVTAISAGAATAHAASPPAPPPAHAVKIATVAPEGTPWMQVMRALDADVRRETGNAVGFKIYPNATQGDEAVVLRKIRTGQLDGGGFTGQGLGRVAPALRVMELPFLWDDHAEVDRAYEQIGPRLEATLKESGFTLLGWADVGFVYLFSRQPIAKEADLKQAKMWVWEGDPLAEAFFRATGVSPVPLPINDVLTSLQTRLVDCVYSSALACLGTQWFSRVSYFTDVPVTYATGAIVISNAAYDKIPGAHRDVFMKLCRAKMRELVVVSRQKDTESLLEIEKSGVKRVTMPAAEVARFVALGREVWKGQVGKLYPQDLLDAVTTVAETTGAGASR
jgi:TRAP-type C4-dicarboxylate transport system substrate-binding protein